MAELMALCRPEMGITHADFRRVFPRLVVEAQAQLDERGARVSWSDGRELRVSMSGERMRAISALRIPYVDLEFEFRGFSADAAAQFMTRFDRAFHRGGG